MLFKPIPLLLRFVVKLLRLELELLEASLRILIDGVLCGVALLPIRPCELAFTVLGSPDSKSAEVLSAGQLTMLNFDLIVCGACLTLVRHFRVASVCRRRLCSLSSRPL